MNESVPGIALLLFVRLPFPAQIPPDGDELSRAGRFRGISETSMRFQTLVCREGTEGTQKNRGFIFGFLVMVCGCFALCALTS
jgi:hypothetical protein